MKGFAIFVAGLLLDTLLRVQPAVADLGLAGGDDDLARQRDPRQA